LKLNPASKAFFIAVTISVILPFVPLARYVLLPFTYLNTHLHEIFHALAAVATGGSVANIQVFANGEGVTRTYGGFGPIISSAGYVGASLFGSIMIIGASKANNARTWLRLLGMILLVVNVVWVRGDWVGWITGFVWAGGLIALAGKIPKENVEE
jgi:hypothetical protein